MEYCSSVVGISMRKVMLQRLRKSNVGPHVSLKATTSENLVSRKCLVTLDDRASKRGGLFPHVQKLCAALWMLKARFWPGVNVQPENPQDSTATGTSMQAHKNCYRSSFFPRTIPEWNHLPPHIRNAVECFKSSLITYNKSSLIT